MASAIMTLLVWNSKQSHAALLTLKPVRLHSAWSVTAARSAIRANGFDRRLGRGTASQYEIVAVLRGESMIRSTKPPPGDRYPSLASVVREQIRNSRTCFGKRAAALFSSARNAAGPRA
jgi:hypothetical protein